MKRTILFYNPAAPYHTLPLQFLALAAVLDRERYDIRIIDARIERSVQDAHRKVKELLPSAAVLGVSVITGSPLQDAVTVSAIARHEAPSVPVVWGGWHASIYPEQCLREGGADYCVSGQGELTFRDLLRAIEAGHGFDAIPGISFLSNGEFRENPARKFVDINTFSPYDYDLLPLETYFRYKGRRQIDFYSSQGCPYRCAFCADPSVYHRRWSGLKAARMLEDVFRAVRKYRLEDVAFQDENFFANRSRVLEFCRGIQEQNMTFTWTATSRADQIAPLDDAMLKDIARAHLRKMIIGAESGSQEMLDLMKKDTLAEEALISAEKLARHGIGATFNFIVGFPEEGFENTLKTLRLIKHIKQINPAFEFGVFFFTPYPGTELFSYIVRKGYEVPQSLAAWSEIDFMTYAGYWIAPDEREYVDRFKFYTRLGTERMRGGPITWPLRRLASLRLQRNYFGFPVEKQVIDFVRQRFLHHAAG